MAFNTPFKMWKRYEFNGGTSDPCIISWPAGPRHAARSASSTTTRSTSCRRSWTCSASRRPRRSRGTRSRRSTVSACATSFDDASAESKPEDAVLRDARLALDLARGLEGRHDPPVHRRLGQLQRRRVGALPRRCRPGRAERPRRRAAGQAPGAGQHLVLGGRRERRLPARRPLAGRDLRPTPRPQLTAPRNRYVYFPDTAPVPRVAGGQHAGTARS